jgi:hypothetical protein
MKWWLNHGVAHAVYKMAAMDPSKNRRLIATLAGVAASGLALGTFSVCARAQTQRAVLQVGPGRAVKTLAAAARMAHADTLIEVDAGDYLADVAIWDKANITVRAVGGRVRLVASGAAAEGKGIWVTRANALVAEGIDFVGAAVSSRNGAGIRLESGSLHVHDCRFTYNEMGLLTNNDPATELTVTNCEFAFNQRPDGHNHNLYVGQIARCVVIGSYFHHARIGHLLKCRAAVSHVFYNRLTDESGGTASYELEFPNGGVAYVVGNIIEQGPRTDNVHIVRFGAEGLKWPRNEIYLVNNTLVDGLPNGGTFLGTAAGTDVLYGVNNLLVGGARLEGTAKGVFHNNFNVTRDAFEQVTVDDYRLRRDSELVGRAITPVRVGAVNLGVDAEYMHPRGTRPLTRIPHNPGAVQQMAVA